MRKGYPGTFSESFFVKTSLFKDRFLPNVRNRIRNSRYVASDLGDAAATIAEQLRKLAGRGTDADISDLWYADLATIQATLPAFYFAFEHPAPWGWTGDIEGELEPPAENQNWIPDDLPDLYISFVSVNTQAMEADRLHPLANKNFLSHYVGSGWQTVVRLKPSLLTEYQSSPAQMLPGMLEMYHYNSKAQWMASRRLYMFLSQAAIFWRPRVEAIGPFLFDPALETQSVQCASAMASACFAEVEGSTGGRPVALESDVCNEWTAACMGSRELEAYLTAGARSYCTRGPCTTWEAHTFADGDAVGDDTFRVKCESEQGTLLPATSTRATDACACETTTYHPQFVKEREDIQKVEDELRKLTSSGTLGDLMRAEDASGVNLLLGDGSGIDSSFTALPPACWFAPCSNKGHDAVLRSAQERREKNNCPQQITCVNQKVEATGSIGTITMQNKCHAKIQRALRTQQNYSESSLLPAALEPEWTDADTFSGNSGRAPGPLRWGGEEGDASRNAVILFWSVPAAFCVLLFLVWIFGAFGALTSSSARSAWINMDMLEEPSRAPHAAKKEGVEDWQHDQLFQ